MKIKVHFIFYFLLLTACGQISQSSNSSVDDSKIITRKVFDFGAVTHFTDSCSFYFQCDCCSGEIVFNPDSSFYYLDYCMSDIFVRMGKYELKNRTIKLSFSPKAVTRIYNYQNEVDTSAIDYFMTDTVLKRKTLSYIISKCDDKMKLIDSDNQFYAIETNKDNSSTIKFLDNEGFSERFLK